VALGRDHRFVSGTQILCQSQWPCGLRRRSVATRLLKMRVRMPLGTLMSVNLQRSDL